MLAENGASHEPVLARSDKIEAPKPAARLESAPELAALGAAFREHAEAAGWGAETADAYVRDLACTGTGRQPKAPEPAPTPEPPASI